ncbi:MAG TPA: hypothetical protein VJ793_10225 [Anaerolineae bacterium]|nr:hypothetical protein [Anaerolineae bacterium]
MRDVKLQLGQQVVRLLELSLRLAGKPTMMSVAIDAPGILRRILSIKRR